MKRVVLIGASGMLGTMVQATVPDAYELVPLSRHDLDIRDRDGVLEKLTRFAPDVIVNCAAFTDVDGCESETELADAVNAAGPGNLALAAKRLGAVLVHVSTDYVFDGTGSRPYTEEDPVAPRSAYGRSKLMGEEAIPASGLKEYFIVRTSWLYGPGGKNFVETMLRLAREREELRVVADQVGSPTYTRDLALAIYRLLSTRSYGIYHFSDEGSCSWHEFASEIIRQYGRLEALRVRSVIPIRTQEYPLPAERPRYSVLSKEKYAAATGARIPDWRESLSAYLKSKTQGGRSDS